MITLSDVRLPTLIPEETTTYKHHTDHGYISIFMRSPSDNRRTCTFKNSCTPNSSTSSPSICLFFVICKVLRQIFYYNSFYKCTPFCNAAMQYASKIRSNTLPPLFKHIIAGRFFSFRKAYRLNLKGRKGKDKFSSQGRYLTLCRCIPACRFISPQDDISASILRFLYHFHKYIVLTYLQEGTFLGKLSFVVGFKQSNGLFIQNLCPPDGIRLLPASVVRIKAVSERLHTLIQIYIIPVHNPARKARAGHISGF